MGALPKRRTSKGRKNRRRAHQALKPMGLVPCDQCKSMKKPHEVCPNCGTYKAKEMIKTE